MNYIIISIDPSTQFLFGIVEAFKVESVPFNLIEVHPNEDSYDEAIEIISNMEQGSNIIFLGHGTDDRLYGGESLLDFPKKDLIVKEQMKFFQSQFLFLLSCNSSGLIKKSFRISKTAKSIGFGALPTSKEEIQEDKKLALQGITEETIELFKTAIVETISVALLKYFKSSNIDFVGLNDLLQLLIDKRINKAILEEKNRSLADLLYKMRDEMVIY